MLAKRRLEDDRYEETVALADRAIAIRPDYRDDIHLVRAVALESLGRREEAEAAYRCDTELRRDSAGVARVEADAHAGIAKLRS